jgi:hypothetical protein
MKTFATTIGIVFLTLSTAAADEVPKVGAYIGYDYVRFNSQTNVPAISANGGSGQFIYNFNRWLSGVVDAGAVHNRNNSGFHRIPFVNPSWLDRACPSGAGHGCILQALFGGVYGTTSAQLPYVRLGCYSSRMDRQL